MIIRLDIVKRKLKLKRVSLETKVKEYEALRQELQDLENNLRQRANSITQTVQEIRHLETVRDSQLLTRHEILPTQS